MADVLALLEHDHRKIEQLFLEFEESQETGTAKRICEELQLHMKLEEEILYPVLGDLGGDVKSLEKEARSEHAGAKKLIAGIESTKGDPELKELMADLRLAIAHHVHEEETELFPQVRERLSGDLERLGRETNRRKQELGGVDPMWAAGLPPAGA